MLMKTGILYFTTCFHGFGILRHVDPFVRMLHICSGYSELHDLTFNAKKSMCMYFSTSMNKHCGCPVIYLGNSICEFVKEVR